MNYISQPKKKNLHIIFFFFKDKKTIRCSDFGPTEIYYRDLGDKLLIPPVQYKLYLQLYCIFLIKDILSYVKGKTIAHLLESGVYRTAGSV